VRFAKALRVSVVLVPVLILAASFLGAFAGSDTRDNPHAGMQVIGFGIIAAIGAGLILRVAAAVMSDPDDHGEAGAIVGPKSQAAESKPQGETRSTDDDPSNR
jgi:hypothetical protein